MRETTNSKVLTLLIINRILQVKLYILINFPSENYVADYNKIGTYDIFEIDIIIPGVSLGNAFAQTLLQLHIHLTK